MYACMDCYPPANNKRPLPQELPVHDINASLPMTTEQTPPPPRPFPSPSQINIPKDTQRPVDPPVHWYHPPFTPSNQPKIATTTTPQSVLGLLAITVSASSSAFLLPPLSTPPKNSAYGSALSSSLA